MPGSGVRWGGIAHDTGLRSLMCLIWGHGPC
jgi:hypothetical protein